MAPGSSKELPIVFRPSELVPYSDFVRIETKDGAYEIRLEARLQFPRFQFPETLKFTPTPVKEHKSEKFIGKVLFLKSAKGLNFVWSGARHSSAWSSGGPEDPSFVEIAFVFGLYFQNVDSFGDEFFPNQNFKTWW